MKKTSIVSLNIFIEKGAEPTIMDIEIKEKQIVKLDVDHTSPALVFEDRKSLEEFTNKLMQLVWDTPRYEELEAKVEDLSYKLQVAADSYNEIANSREVMSYD